MGDTQLAELKVEVNDEHVGIVANSLRFNEGLGQQTIRAVSEGNGRAGQVFANDIEQKFGMVSFAMPTTIQNRGRARRWKQGRNTNVVTLSGRDEEGNDIQLVYTQCSFTENYEVEVSVDGNIPVTFEGNPPTG